MAVSFHQSLSKQALNDAGIPNKLLTIKKLIKALTKNYDPNILIGINVIADNIDEFWILNPNAFKIKTYNGVKALTLTDIRVRHSLPPKGSTRIPKPTATSVGVNTEEILDRFNQRYDYNLEEVTQYNTDFIVEFLRDTIDKDLSELIKLKEDFEKIFGDKTRWDFNADIKCSKEDMQRIEKGASQITEYQKSYNNEDTAGV